MNLPKRNMQSCLREDWFLPQHLKVASSLITSLTLGSFLSLVREIAFLRVEVSIASCWTFSLSLYSNMTVIFLCSCLNLHTVPDFSFHSTAVLWTLSLSLPGIDGGKKLGVEPVLAAADMARPDVEYLANMGYIAYYQWIRPRDCPSDTVAVNCDLDNVRVNNPVSCSDAIETGWIVVWSWLWYSFLFDVQLGTKIAFSYEQLRMLLHTLL